jgi:uncharacterized phage infection (PIP) family protein YhgE
VKSFLSRLSTFRSFVLFSIALAIGVFSIAFELRPWWLPLAAVTVYSGLLAISERRYLVELNSTVKDSPYFLGFILTMGALTKIFTDIANAGGNTSAMIPTIVGEAGAAILATVFGLFGRQVLLSLDLSEQDRDQQFPTLAQQMRESSAEFHRTQRRFIGLVEEFVNVRERLFSQEEAAASKYISHLEEHSRSLEALEREYPSRLAATSGAFEGAVNQLGKSVDAVSRQIAMVSNQSSEVLKSETDLLASSLESSRARIEQERQGLQKQVSLASEVFAQLLTILKSTSMDVTTLASQLPTSTNAVASGLARIADESVTTNNALAELQGRIRQWSESLVEADRSLANNSSQFTSGLSERAEALRADLSKIDAIVDELVEVLRERMRSAAAF